MTTAKVSRVFHMLNLLRRDKTTEAELQKSQITIQIKC